MKFLLSSLLFISSQHTVISVMIFFFFYCLLSETFASVCSSTGLLSSEAPPPEQRQANGSSQVLITSSASRNNPVGPTEANPPAPEISEALSTAEGETAGDAATGGADHEDSRSRTSSGSSLKMVLAQIQAAEMVQAALPVGCLS